MNLKTGLISLIALLLAALSACCPSGHSQERVNLRRSDDCMLVVFHEWVGPGELQSFFKEQVHGKDPVPGGGWSFRPGLISLIRRSGPPDLESYEICFSPEAPKVLREQIRSEVAVAPEVSRVETVDLEPLKLDDVR